MHRTAPTRRALMLAGLGLAASVQAARIDSLGVAIDQSGAQRMLSQRMGKAWLGLALQLPVRDAPRVLSESMARFERQLDALLDFAPTAALRGQYRELGERYRRYRELLMQAPSLQRAGLLIEQASEVLKTAHAATGALQQQAAQPAAVLVNVAGRQRMLSQRMSLLYLAGSTALQPEVDKLRSEFLAAHARLRDAPEATSEIKTQLAMADAQWLFFDTALRGDRSQQRAAADVFITSENLLQVMEKVTGLYARVLAA